MSHSLTKMYVHLVFSTKYRFPFLQNKTVREELHGYIGSIITSFNSRPIIINGVADHIHILFINLKNYLTSKITAEVKRLSSMWAKTRSEDLRKFYWQIGYGAFSVSEDQSSTRYINISKIRKIIT